jgi:tetratricopeptide (TPR) repeat protein
VTKPVAVLRTGVVDAATLRQAILWREILDKPLALRFVNQATELTPSYAGGWYRRSILRYDADDRAGAIADIQETLKREPRHFGALAGLGMIYEDMGQEKAALNAYRRALEIHPFLDSARQGLQRLEPKVEGQDT